MDGIALVVGGSSDIGRSIAVRLARLGLDLVLWGRDEVRLRVTAAAVEQAGAAATTHALDLLDRSAVRTATEALAGSTELVVVVWAAGVFDWAPAAEADPDTWATVLDLNLVSAAVLTAAVMPSLVLAAPSALVYLGSGAARRVYANNAAYVAAKHGLLGLAAATFLDVRDAGVKVSVVSPGLVAAGAGLLSLAGQTVPNQLLAPDDVAAAVEFVVTFPSRGCPVEIDLQPQLTPP